MTAGSALTHRRRGSTRATIVELIEEITESDHGDIHSILIAKDGKLVVEEYFANNGKKHGPFITSLFRTGSITWPRPRKVSPPSSSVIAIHQGFIKSVEDPIYRYLPAYDSLFTEDKKRIRISHMLTMTPGFLMATVRRE